MNIVKCLSLYELITAISPEMEIDLENERYDLTDLCIDGHEYVYQIENGKNDDFLLRDLFNLTIKSDIGSSLYLHDGSLILEGCKDIKFININFHMFYKNKTPIILRNCSNIFLDCSINSDFNIVLELINCSDIFITAKNTDGLIKLDNCERIYSDISVYDNSVGLKPLKVEDEIAVTVNDHYNKIIKKIEVSSDINIVYSVGEKLAIYNNKEEYTNDRMPSAPVLSLRKYKCAFIAPYEWETIGDLYVYDFKKNTSEIVLSAEIIESQNCVKKVIWKNEEELYLIIGLAYGTVSRGGNVYTFNLHTRNLEKLFSCRHMEEVIDFSIQNKKMELKIIKFDNNFDKYEERLENLEGYSV